MSFAADKKRRKYNKIFKLLSVIAVSTVIADVLYLFFGNAAFIMWPIMLLLSFAGYGVEALSVMIVSGRRETRVGYSDETGYEEYEDPFNVRRAVFPITLGAVLAVLTYKLYDLLLLYASRSVPEIVYTENSLIPFILSGLTFVGFCSGVVLWFYPAHRIISLRSMFAFVPAFWIVFLVSLYFNRDSAPMAVFLTVFAFCSFIVLNQTHIQRSVSDTLTAINGKGRIYNLKLMLFIALLFLLILLVMSAIVVGISKILRFIAAIVLAASLNKRAESQGFDGYYADVDEANDDMIKLLGGEPLGERLLFILFILLFIGGIAFIITRGTKVMRRFSAAVKEWFSELFMFFMNAWHFNRFGAQEEEVTIMNYRDEEIKLQRADINEYGRKVPPTTYGFRDFMSKLNALGTTEERIRFAYTTMMASYRSRGMGNRVTDTPREARDTVAGKVAENAINTATDAIEQIDYMESEISEEAGTRAIHEMCGVIEKHFNS